MELERATVVNVPRTLVIDISGGGGGIRTHETRIGPNGFQDRLLRPLGHPSGSVPGHRVCVQGRSCDDAGCRRGGGGIRTLEEASAPYGISSAAH